MSYWLSGVVVLLLVAWIAAGLVTYLGVAPFLDRFITYALALVALAAGAIQVLAWFHRPFWDP